MPSNLNLDYYYGSEAEQYSFYRIPKVLLTDPRYKNVSIEAKVLYGLLLDRMGLSVKNGWMDGDRRVYIYFTQEDAMEMMDCGHNKAVRLFADLELTGLIERKRQGQGRPTRIYVKNFILPPDQSPEPEPPSPPEDSQTSGFGKSDRPVVREKDVLTSDFGKSALPETGGLDFPKRDANKTEKNNTELNDTDPSILPPTPVAPVRPPAGKPKGRMRMDEMDRYRELIKENIDYDLLLTEHPYDEETLEGYVELMAEVCCSRRDLIRIAGDEVAAGVVKSRFLKLNHEHIAYVLESLSRNTTLIKNIKAYTLAALYNAPTTISQYYA
ncbi:MAG: replication initiator protein A [Oscillospiraceae bacterium]|nr:replication initiator protein A [Oscillospiraceae bacterium]